MVGIRVTQGNQATVRVTRPDSQRFTVKQVSISAGGDATEIDRLSELSDVDASDSDNNEVLVYNSSTNKYEVKVIPEVDGGSF